MVTFYVYVDAGWIMIEDLGSTSDREPTRWQLNRIYILSPLHTHNSLRENDRYCFHPGIFPCDIMLRKLGANKCPKTLNKCET